MKFVSSKELEKKIADFKHGIEEKKLDAQSEIDLLKHELECMENDLLQTMTNESLLQKKKTGPKGPTGPKKKVKFDGRSCLVPYSNNQSILGVQTYIRVPINVMKCIDKFVIDNCYTRRSFAINYILKFYVENYIEKKFNNQQ